MPATQNAASTVEAPEGALPRHVTVLFERLTRLRVITAPQAHVLNPPFARHSLRSTYARLATLVRNRLLVTDSIYPKRGAASHLYYRLGFRALVALGLKHKLGLLQKPAQQVLEYFVARTDAYSQATAGGWLIGSPIFLAPEKRADALAHLNKYLRVSALERYRAAQAANQSAEFLLRMQTELERLPAFLPRELGFEFVCRFDGRTHAVTSAVLLLVDDVRRSVASQVDALPLAAKDDCRVLIRAAPTRLSALRRAVIARLGPEAPLDHDFLLKPFNPPHPTEKTP